MTCRLVFKPEECVACYACVIACIDQKDTDTGAGERPCRKPLEYDKLWDADARRRALAAACLHCVGASCIPACPEGCIVRDEETGFVGYDDDTCSGCGACMEACAFGAITFSVDGKVRKCDGCMERVRRGLEPACTLTCPTHALILRRDD